MSNIASKDPDSQDVSSQSCAKLQLWRQRFAFVGLVALVAIAGFSILHLGNVLAYLAFIALILATATGWVEYYCRRHLQSPLSVSASPRSSLATVSMSSAETPRSLERIIVPVVIVLVTVGAVWSWFAPGGAIANGDISPPNGTAWLAHMFASWSWTGSGLGLPANQEVLLPWGVVLWFIHNLLGGSSALAQQVWYSILFAGAALGSYALLRLLHLSPLSALCGSLVWVFNSYVLTVALSPNYLMALLLAPVEASIFLAVMAGRWRIRTGVLCLLGSVPLLGYVYTNPPLLLGLGISVVAGVLFGSFLYGRRSLRRAVRLFLLGAPLVFLGSLYWLVPSFMQLPFTASKQLSPIGSWAWTETRSTLNNAFWLNTSWAWSHNEYYPYAYHYLQFPLVMLKYAIPILAFSALSIPYSYRDGKRLNHLLLAVLASSISLVFIFLSTGTNFPGSILFDLLYRLPYGWLLQAPGRFLFLTALGYVVLVSIVMSTVLSSITIPMSIFQKGKVRALMTPLVVAIVILLGVILPGYPLAFGSVVNGPMPRYMMPSTHVKVPLYWTAMASYLNAKGAVPGNLLLLPPDDFYHMPYTWYYGTDGFIINMLSRNVLDPSAQGYASTSSEVMDAVNEVASTLLSGSFRETNLLLHALGTPDVLVRGDIVSEFPGRQIDSPRSLADALAHDPYMEFVHRSGPLELFRLRYPKGTIQSVHFKVPYATVNVRSPNLQDLGLFNRSRLLVSHSSIPGVPAVYQLPPPVDWRQVDDHLQFSLPFDPGQTYSVAEFNKTTFLPSVHELFSSVGSLHAKVVRDKGTSKIRLSIPLAGKLLTDGTFQHGGWGVVGDCNDVLGAAARPYLHAQVLQSGGPQGEPALRLAASEDLACVSKQLSWHGGPIYLKVSMRLVAGSQTYSPVCLWEVGPQKCAKLPAFSLTSQWRKYKAIVTPSPGTRAVSLFLYAGPPASGKKGIAEYAQVSAYGMPELSADTSLAIVSRPTRATNSRVPSLTTLEASYSPIWRVSSPAEHVVVDGISNGWLSTAGTHLHPYDSLRPLIQRAFDLALVAGAIGVVLLVSLGVSVAQDRQLFANTIVRHKKTK